eukprot:TRINITY_DN1453_c0_g1_i1.p1 TRINITY_DN1453_c0_g1~~TRINITY_DN1453_c0_g1_i1.p1  ORF type:complete len:332 (-),score=49.94 TRINITY_DN1453_c0_g1_i1:259-1254(-)
MLHQAIRRLNQLQLFKKECIVCSRWYSSQARDKSEEEEDEFGEDLVKEALERAKQKGTVSKTPTKTTSQFKLLDQKQLKQEQDEQDQRQEQVGEQQEDSSQVDGDERLYKRSWKNLMQVPVLPRRLTYAGVIPLVVLCPPIVRNCIDPFIQLSFLQYAGELQMIYAAGVLSFLGAVHWGVAFVDGKDFATASNVQNTTRYLWGVVPMLLSWPVATLLQPGNAGIIMAALFMLVFDIDVRMTQKSMLPPWYLKIRSTASLIAIAAVTFTFADSYGRWFSKINREIMEEEMKAYEEGNRWTDKQVIDRFLERMTNKDEGKPQEQKEQSQTEIQ